VGPDRHPQPDRPVRAARLPQRRQSRVLAGDGRARVPQATGRDSFELGWLPRFTPSRIPLLDQRWTAVPAGPPLLQIVDAGAVLPMGSQTGVRWSHVGDRLEYSLSFFDGFNHLPNIDESVKPDTLLPEVDV
jgi:hypothetical protein